MPQPYTETSLRSTAAPAIAQRSSGALATLMSSRTTLMSPRTRSGASHLCDANQPGRATSHVRDPGSPLRSGRDDRAELRSGRDGRAERRTSPRNTLMSPRTTFMSPRTRSGASHRPDANQPGRATAIVTAEQDLLDLHPFENIPIITPASHLQSHPEP